jgi:multiple sugar transport system permease protein
MMARHSFVGLENYRMILFDDPLWAKALINTVYYTGVSVPLGILLAFFVALLLNQRILFVSVFRTVYYLPSVVAGVAVSILWLWMFHPEIGLIKAGFRLIGVQSPPWLSTEAWAMPAIIVMGLWGIGNSIVILLAGLQGVPTQLYDAAKMDGAGELACFWHITVPMMTPSLFFLLVMGIIGAFQVFTQPYVMTQGGPNNATLTYVMMIYNKGFMQFRFGYGSALAWILFGIILLFTLLAIRFTIKFVYYEGDIKR